MDAENITLDNSTFKALASETRVAILRSLDARRKTASELSHELGASVQGISEHLHGLQQAGLVERNESGRKWVYYQLTAKGFAVLHPDSKKFWVLVSLSLLALLGYFYSPYFFAYQAPNSLLARDTASSASNRMALTTPQATPALTAGAPSQDSGARPADSAQAAQNTRAMAVKSTEAWAQAQPQSPQATTQNSRVAQAQDANSAAALSSNEGLFLIAAAFFLAAAGWIKLVKKSA